MALDEIRNTKIKKIEELRKSGVDPYPSSSSRTNSVKEAIENVSFADEIIVIDYRTALSDPAKSGIKTVNQILSTFKFTN